MKVATLLINISYPGERLSSLEAIKEELTTAASKLSTVGDITNVSVSAAEVNDGAECACRDDGEDQHCACSSGEAHYRDCPIHDASADAYLQDCADVASSFAEAKNEPHSPVCVCVASVNAGKEDWSCPVCDSSLAEDWVCPPIILGEYEVWDRYHDGEDTHELVFGGTKAECEEYMVGKPKTQYYIAKG